MLEQKLKNSTARASSSTEQVEVVKNQHLGWGEGGVQEPGEQGRGKREKKPAAWEIILPSNLAFYTIS